MTKQEDKVLKFTKRLIKKTWANMLNIRSIINTKERFLFLSTIIITIFLWIYFKINIIFVFAIQYFIYKALFQIIKEDAISFKYKGISKLFDNKVKIISVSKDKMNFVLYSFVSKKAVEKKIDEIEHFLNREILCITRDEKNFKLMTITTKFPDENKKKTTKLSKIYPLQDYIKTQKISNKFKIPLFVGIDKHGKFIIDDLTNLYHIFIAGETGSGKSTILNSMLQSMMYFCGNINFIFVDFKLVELGIYDEFSNCYCIENNSEFIDKLIWLEEEMMKRYKLFKENKIKNIWQYNKLGNNMNYIILVIDEISNIKLSGKTKKKNNESEIDVEDKLANLLNMARASGIFIIAATQNPYGVEIKTNVRSKFVTNISGRIERPEVQKTTTVLGTENFKKGEFKMNAPGHRGTEFISFYIDDITHNKVFEELEKIYTKGGVNIANKC